MPPWAPILYVGRCSECLTATGHDFHLEGGARWKRARLPMATRLRPSRESTGRVGLRKTGKVGTGCGGAAANIVQVFDFDQVEGRYYIAMELVRGTPCARWWSGAASRRCGSAWRARSTSAGRS